MRYKTAAAIMEKKMRCTKKMPIQGRRRVMRTCMMLVAEARTRCEWRRRP